MTTSTAYWLICSRGGTLPCHCEREQLNLWLEVRYWELWIKNEEFTGEPNGGKERYTRSLELQRRRTWNIYIRWVYIVMHDFIWVLFTEVYSSYVARASVRLSENLVKGTRQHSGYVHIYPDSPSLVRLSTQICSEFRISSHSSLKPSHRSLRQRQWPHFIGPHWQHHDRNVLITTWRETLLRL